MTNRETGHWSTHDNRLTDIIRTVGRVYGLIYDLQIFLFFNVSFRNPKFTYSCAVCTCLMVQRCYINLFQNSPASHPLKVIRCSNTQKWEEADTCVNIKQSHPITCSNLCCSLSLSPSLSPRLWHMFDAWLDHYWVLVGEEIVTSVKSMWGFRLQVCTSKINMNVCIQPVPTSSFVRHSFLTCFSPHNVRQSANVMDIQRNRAECWRHDDFKGQVSEKH